MAPAQCEIKTKIVYQFKIDLTILYNFTCIKIGTDFGVFFILFITNLQEILATYLKIERK